MRIDDQLRRALASKDPPAGFLGRTLSRIAAAEASPPLPSSGAPGSRRSVLLALAASLVLAIGGSRYLVYRQAVHDAARARNEVAAALAVVGRTLTDVQMKVQAAVERAGVNHERDAR